MFSNDFEIYEVNFSLLGHCITVLFLNIFHHSWYKESDLDHIN